VTVNVITYQAEFSYTIQPKQSPHAYLKALITNICPGELQYPLLGGGISVFVDGNFVAKSYIGTVQPTEKLSVFLGTDPAIKFEYQPLKQLKDTKGILQKTSSLKVKFNTVITNNKSKEIKVHLLDSLPKSNEHSMQVILVNPPLTEDNNYNSNDCCLIRSTNTVQWSLNIPAQTKIEVPFMYNVEYPVSKEIDGAF